MSAVGRQLEIGWTGAFEAFRAKAPDVVGGLASRAFREGCSLVLRTQTTSRDRRSLRSAGGHLDGMDFMDGMDSEPRSAAVAGGGRGGVERSRGGCWVRAGRGCFGRGPRHAVVARFARRAVSWTKWTSWTEWTPNREALHLRRTGGVHRMLRGDGLLRVDGWRLGRGPRHAVDARFARRAVTWTRWTRMDRDGHGWTRWTRTAKRCTCGGRAACIGCSGATASCGSMAGVLGAGHVMRSTLASLGGRSIGRDGLHGRNGPEPRSAAAAAGGRGGVERSRGGCRVRAGRWCFGRGPHHAVDARFARPGILWTRWTSWTEWTSEPRIAAGAAVGWRRLECGGSGRLAWTLRAHEPAPARERFSRREPRTARSSPGPIRAHVGACDP